MQNNNRELIAAGLIGLACLALALIGLWLDNRPPLEVRLCERYIVDGLRLPSTYERLSYHELLDQPIGRDEYRRSRPDAYRARVEMDLGIPRRVDTVLIEYAADGGRGAGVCAFERNASDRDRKRALDDAMARAERQRMVALGYIPGDVEQEGGLRYRCCL